jgi:diphthamide biosynthesis protein 2
MDTQTSSHVPALALYRETTDFPEENGFSYAKVDAPPVSHPHLKLNGSDEDELVSKISQYYDLDALVGFLQQQTDGVPKYRRITLQFPDSLICDSATIVHELQRRLQIPGCRPTSVSLDSSNETSCSSSGSCNGGVTEGKSFNGGATSCCSGGDGHHDSATQKLWILADTSYSSCCIDEVAAEHVNSDVVVHFGDACLNIVDKLPAVYVFGKPQLNRAKIIESFTSEFSKHDKVMLMADGPNTRILADLYDELHHDYDLAYGDVYIDARSDATILGYTPYRSDDAIYGLNRSFHHVSHRDNGDHGDHGGDGDNNGDNGDDNGDNGDNNGDNNGIDVESILSQYKLFHIGVPETPRLLQLTTRFADVVLYDPHTDELNHGPFPALSRRYRYMQVARTSGTIGLLVNTLSLTNTKQLMEKITTRIKRAGKKHYLFVVGKPNVAKLANFENIDVWCIVGCDHQGVIIDQYNEYFKPIITPYELMVALNDEMTWTGKWVTDFNEVLREMEEEKDGEDEEKKDGEDEEKKDGEDEDKMKQDDGMSSDEEPEFDPVTGRFVSTSRPLRKLNHIMITEGDGEGEETDSTNALVKKFSSQIAIKNTVSTSAAYLQSRHWTGLGSDFTDDGEDKDGAVVEEGTSGIARGYDFDVSNQQK